MIVIDLPEKLTGDTFKGRVYEVIVNGNLKDMSNTSIRCEFRYGQKTGPVTKTLTKGAGFTVLALGSLRMDAFDIDFKPGIYYFDIEFNDAGDKSTYTGGQWKIDQDTTKPPAA